MEILHIQSQANSKSCDVRITESEFIIEGDFYYLIDKEFRRIKQGRGTCPIKEYLGLGVLCKRSPKQLIRFVVLAVVLELVNTVAGWLGDYLFFVNTDWTSYIVNAAAVLCLVQGIRLFFSKKKVIEISFLTKRFCVDENLFRKEDIDRLNQILLKLRQGK